MLGPLQQQHRQQRGIILGPCVSEQHQLLTLLAEAPLAAGRYDTQPLSFNKPRCKPFSGHV